MSSRQLYNNLIVPLADPRILSGKNPNLGGVIGFNTPARVYGNAATGLPAYTVSGKTLVANANGALPNIDGVALAKNDRVFIDINPGTAVVENGIYYVKDLGSASTPWILERTTDADENGEIIAGMLTLIGEGTAHASEAYVVETGGSIVVGTTAIKFVLFISPASSITGFTSADNTGIGIGSGTAITTAVDSSSFGVNSLNSNSTGNRNSAFGDGSAATSTNANDISAFGFNAAAANTANETTAFGSRALEANTTGAGNTAFGFNSALLITTGTRNTNAGYASNDAANTSDVTTFGYNTATANTANETTAFGSRALEANTSGVGNTAFGFNSALLITTGTRNTNAGHSSNDAANTSDVTSFGYNSATANTANETTAFGSRALEANTSGAGNTAFGFNAALLITTGTRNTNAGYASNDAANTSDVTSFGYNAATANSANEITAFGSRALEANTIGVGNTAVGFGAGLLIDEGSRNTNIGHGTNNAANTDDVTAVGYNAAGANTASETTAFGSQALQLNTTGAANTAFGYNAGAATTNGNNNTFGGYNAGSGANVSNCTIFGANAAPNNTASGITAFGNNVLNAKTTGDRVAAFGNDVLSVLNTAGNQDLTAFGSSINFTATNGSAESTFFGSQIGTGTAFAIDRSVINGVMIQDGALASSADSTAIGYKTARSSNLSNSVLIGREIHPITSSSKNFTASIGIGASINATTNAEVITSNVQGQRLLEYLTGSITDCYILGSRCFNSDAPGNGNAHSKNVIVGGDVVHTMTTTETYTNNIFLGFNSGKSGVDTTIDDRIAIGVNARAANDYDLQIGQAAGTTGVAKYRAQQFMSQTWNDTFRGLAQIDTSGNIQKSRELAPGIENLTDAGGVANPSNVICLTIVNQTALVDPASGTLANGTTDGAIKKVILRTLTASRYDLTVTSCITAAGGAAASKIFRFNNIGQSISLIWSSSATAWFIDNTGVTII